MLGAWHLASTGTSTTGWNSTACSESSATRSRQRRGRCGRGAAANAVVLRQGRRILHGAGMHHYAFQLDFPQRLPVDAPAKLVIEGRAPVDVIVAEVKGLSLTVVSPDDLGRTIAGASLQTDMSFSLERLITRLEAAADRPAGCVMTNRLGRGSAAAGDREQLQCRVPMVTQPVIRLHGAPYRAGAVELDDPGGTQCPDVVGDYAEQGAELLREVGGTHRLMFQREHDLQAQWVAEATKQVGSAGEVVDGWDADRVSLKVGSS